jgi:hypothetical protein
VAHPSATHITSDVPKFDVVEAVTPVGTAPCAECHGPIADTYYEVDDGVVCAACHTRVAASLETPTTGAGFARATLFGIAGAAVAVAMYFVLSAAANRDATIALVIAGFLIGKAVRIGGRRQRGRRYQWLAVTLTYLAIATTYVPFVMKGFSRDSAAEESATIAIPGMTGLLAAVPVTTPAGPAPKSLGATSVDLAELTALALVAPLLESTSHPLNLIVLASALLLAWRTNPRAAVRISGPYRVRVAAV